MMFDNDVLKKYINRDYLLARLFLCPRCKKGSFKFALVCAFENFLFCDKAGKQEHPCPLDTFQVLYRTA